MTKLVTVFIPVLCPPCVTNDEQGGWFPAHDDFPVTNVTKEPQASPLQTRERIPIVLLPFGRGEHTP
jgi:hypothetical protein